MDLFPPPRTARPRLLSLLAALAALAGCGGGGGAAGASSARLAPLGAAQARLHPGGQLRLQVVLAEEGRGPVASARVDFAVADGDAAGAALDRSSALTDEAGVASATLSARGLTAAGGFRVVARAPDWPGAAPARFQVSVVPVRRLLRIESGASVEPAADGQGARVRLSPSGSAWLKVVARDADTQAPLAGQRVTFAVGGLGSAARFAPGAPQASATADAAGEARALLVAGARAESFPVSAAAADDPDAGVLLFDVEVAAPGAACPPCPAGQGCDPAARACVPDAGGPPDPSGAWRVQHLFALDGALPRGLDVAFAALRTLDRALSGALGLPGWLEGLLKGLVDRSVPDWARIAVRVGDTLATLSRHLRSEGELRLTAEPLAPGRFAAGEAWTGISVYFLPQCCPGGPLSGSCPALAADPAEPLACARVRLPVAGGAAAGAAQCQGRPLPPIAVDARPFEAALVGSGPAGDRAPWTLQVGPRQVGLRMGTVTVAAVDALLARFTPWHCLEEATDCSGGSCALDCRGLAGALARLSGGALGAGAVEQVCSSAVGLAGLEVSRALESAVFEADALRFSGHARVTGFAGDGVGTAPPGGSSCDTGRTCAGQLGSPDFDAQTRADARAGTASRDGSWEGAFFRARAGMPGGWEATR